MEGVAVTGLQDIQATRYAALASGVIVLFEHVITFGDEIDLIWASHWKAGKILFIINRYFTFTSVMFNQSIRQANTRELHSDSTDSTVQVSSRHPYLIPCTWFIALTLRPSNACSCEHFFRWQGWTGLFACMIAEVILQMRLYALYFLNKKILLLMLSTFLLSTAAAGTIMGKALSDIATESHVLPGFPACVPVAGSIPSYFYAFWIPILLFETLLCILALHRAFTSEGAIFGSARKLVHAMVRDSVFYFLVMFATYLTNLLVWLNGRVSLLEIPIAFSVTLSCVLTNRIVLNVRRANHDITNPSREAQCGQEAGTELHTITRITADDMMQLRSMRPEPYYEDEGFAVL
ncbi:hypothetical protein CPB85DRAFT_1438896 [Mucidula mucida]|nr:hypothetical protein CPB85DRAFT_1438896 [Mucidula mucida]